MGKENNLDKPTTALSGIGPRKAQTIKKLNLETVRDVLFSYPRTYKDFQRTILAHQVEVGKEQLVSGPVAFLQERPISRGRRLIQAQLGGILKLTWFVHHRGRGSSYLYRRLQGTKELWVFGLVKEEFGSLEMSSPEFFLKPPSQGLFPVYPLISGVSNEQRIKWVKEAFRHIHELIDPLAPKLREGHLDRTTALRWIHFPRNWQDQNRARQRLVFEEFFLFHLGLQFKSRPEWGIVHQPDGSLVDAFYASLPFELTMDQRTVLKEVARDLESPYAMRRLIQGEVGSGKTVIAEYAAVKAVENGGQVAMMVPTEVLARQMYQRLKTVLEPLGIKVALLIGQQRNKEQQEVRTDLLEGNTNVVVGTHALITNKVGFTNLTLAIVDEEHRFGVRQRLTLLDKGNADLLVMSATPIPRSLALTAYGDLETSEIRELPKGRQAIDTRLVDPQKRDDVYRYLVSRVAQGEQGFVVFPLVEESEHLELKAAVQEMENLQKGLLSSVRVGLIHGQMGKEKEQVFDAFYRQQIDVLLATTVIEVGMDVPNATVMIIENAERFGLAQLHQLRGRVGRGQKQGICFLLSYSTAPQSKARLEVIRKSTDGFFIAEEDLRLRGPGDLLGIRQSGQPLFRIADLQNDLQELKRTARLAQALLRQDPELETFPQLRAELERQR